MGNTTNILSSENNEMRELGLGLGLGLGIPLLFLIGVVVGWWLRSKLKLSEGAIKKTRTLEPGSLAPTCSELPDQA